MPAAFVMENVKGLLSSSVDGDLVFDRVLDDLSKVGNGAYRLVPLAPRSGQSFFVQMGHPPASDFVVRAEDHGIPQSRHRVIVVGIRVDIAEGLDDREISAALLPQSQSPVKVRDVLRGMPKLRSGLSIRNDSEETWQSEVSRIMRNVSKAATGLSDEDSKRFKHLGERVARRNDLQIFRTASCDDRAQAPEENALTSVIRQLPAHKAQYKNSGKDRQACVYAFHCSESA
jgi:DNA (cytosine-5)-methyltransferase 1